MIDFSIFIIIIFIVFGIAMFLAIDGYDGIGLVLVIICIICVALGLGLACFGIEEETFDFESDINICALKGGDVSGGIFFTRGRIEEKDYIYFVIEDGQGGKEVRNVPADDVKFYENCDRPHLETYIKTKRSTWACFYVESITRAYKFYVPENTITTDFIIDLE